MAENGRPVTKEDLIAALAGFEGRFDEKLEGLEGRFDEKLEGLEGRFEAKLDKKLEDLETKLLTEFHGYAERIDMRLRRVEANEANSGERILKLEASNTLIAHERRLREIEKRLKIPPLPEP